MKEYDDIIKTLSNIDEYSNFKHCDYFSIYGYNISQFNYFIWLLYESYNLQQKLKSNLLIEQLKVSVEHFPINPLQYQFSNVKTGNIIQTKFLIHIHNQKVCLERINNINSNDIVGI